MGVKCKFTNAMTHQNIVLLLLIVEEKKLH